MFVTGLANMVLIGPATTKVMMERKRQGRSFGEARGRESKAV